MDPVGSIGTGTIMNNPPSTVSVDLTGAIDGVMIHDLAEPFEFLL
jgi:hypothetical protein